MTVIGLLVAVLRAIPALAKLVMQVADALREREAQERRDAKDTAVDAAIDRVRVDQAGQRAETYGTAGLPPSCEGVTRMVSGCVEDRKSPGV